VVFDTGRRTLRQFLQAIAGDFENDPELQALCSKKAPKFGTTDPTALELSRRLSKFLFDVYQSRTGPRGGHYRPAYWTMTNHAGQGMLCGALPSGRKKGESFASGMTPCAGAAGELTECLRAVAAIDATTIPGGLALNLKFPAVNGSDDAIKLAQTVEAYFAMGGMHLQCNIATREMLVDAKKHPHDYPGLLVRVSGYSAYFADLTPRMQDEIIARTAYPLNNERIAGKQSITPEKEVSHA
jgi:formate C-acetyltransferase